jgi:hypothetical protein
MLLFAQIAGRVQTLAEIAKNAQIASKKIFAKFSFSVSRTPLTAHINC